jgi:peptidyl-prolyl cis-trans isomerase SurA
MPSAAERERMLSIARPHNLNHRTRSFGGALAAAALAAALCAAPAHAQVAAVVNGEPITALDIAQRTRLIQLSTQKTPPRQEVLDELIDDKLKVHLARRYIAEVPKREIDGAYGNMARRAGMTTDQFGKAMGQVGISVESLKARIHADYVWTQIIRGKFKSSLQIGEKEVAAKLGTQKDPASGFDFALRPILFLVPRGSAPAAYEARKREAENLRSRFQSCAEGLRAAMTLPDVAVREVISRQSSDLGQQQRDVLNNTPVGKLTPPEVTSQGVETFAVCEKKAAVGGESPREREVRETMYQEKYQALSKKYLKELRSQALIEIRQQ